MAELGGVGGLGGGGVVGSKGKKVEEIRRFVGLKEENKHVIFGVKELVLDVFRRSFTLTGFLGVFV